MRELLFGTAGIPHSVKGSGTVAGIERVKELGLGAMELEFVQQVNVSEQAIPAVRAAAEKNAIALTCHGQYYVNLAATDKAKLDASKKRMLHAARTIAGCGGWSITWHLAFYQGQEKEHVYQMVKSGVKEVLATLADEGKTLWLRPETTGKPTQWGDLKECIRLSQDLEHVLPCVDFAHLHARANGKENTLEEFRAQLALIENGLGREALDNMHIQVAGINYSEKGERNHLNLVDSDFNYNDLLKAWKEFRLKGVVIAESPNIEGDALLLQDVWKSLQQKP
jgi:deoxyribonuclease-4